MDELFEELWSMECRICGDQEKAKAFARGFLGRHAHELAERIRAAYDGEGPDEDNWIMNISDAADLIDPEVST